MATEADLARVRVEDGSSMGRSYTATARKVKGLGAQRRELRTKSFNVTGPCTLHSLPYTHAHLSKSTRQQVLEYFRNGWELNDTLFAHLRDDSVFYMIPDKLRRPLIFYFAHCAAVYANKMHLAGLIDNVDLYLQKMFETGVDEMSWDDMSEMQDEDYEWPSVADAQAFRLRVKAIVEAKIAEMPEPCEAPVTMASPYWALFMGMEHERIHIETSSVLIRQLPIDCVTLPEGWRDCPFRAATPDAAPANELVDVPAGVAVLGKPRDFPSYGWDNEYGKRVVEVPAFRASKYLCTNAEFLPFVMAGGYRERRWWVSPTGDDEGWRWVSYRNATHPSFWVATTDMSEFFGGKSGYPYQKDDGHARAGSGRTFRLRTEFDIIDMPWDWPVEANYLEARAFLNWKAAQEGDGSVHYRIPTEAEYHLIRDDPCPFPEATTGKRAEGQVAGRPLDAEGVEVATKHPLLADAAASAVPEPLAAAAAEPEALGAEERVDVIMQPRVPGNTNWKWLSPSPVTLYPASTAGFHDTHGNVWEYVEDHFAELPDFQIHFLYDDFSTPCFDGWHTMLLGGSWVSTGDQSSSFARYAFRRHFFQHLGFRYVAVPAKEPYPGHKTVANLWEGRGEICQSVTNGFAEMSVKVDAPGDLTVAGGASYPENLAAAVRDLYTAHKGAARPAAGEGARVLHVGCGAGGLSMALTRHFSVIEGVDDDEVLIRHARVIKHHGQVEYERVMEGVLTDTTLVFVGEGVDRARANYWLVSDWADLGSAVPGASLFDCVVIEDKLCAMTQPLPLLRAARALVQPGGVLITALSDAWDPLVTPRNSWLGGFFMNGEKMTTTSVVSFHLKGAFRVAAETNVPKLTRHTTRRYTLDMLEVVCFRREDEAGAEGAGTAAGGGAAEAEA